METILVQWLDALKRQDYAAGANLWLRTPQALGVAFSKRFWEDGRDFTVTPYYGDRRFGKIFKIESTANSFGFIGVIEHHQRIGLVSPQTVYRCHCTHNWHRWRLGRISIISEKKTLLSASVKSRLKNALASISRYLGNELTSGFNYYVPAGDTYLSFLRMENQIYAKTKCHKRSWLDPFGGDIISQDPSDIHELAHGCANAFAGWPPPLMREGLAECFTTPYDWRQWLELRRLPPLAQIWLARPGSISGWYTGAAIFVVMAYCHLGKRKFIDFWNQIQENASYDDAAECLNLTVNTMNDKYRQFCQQSIQYGGSVVPSGLIKRLVYDK